jgi:hypothetical protein
MTISAAATSSADSPRQDAPVANEAAIRPPNMAMPPMTGTSPAWFLRPPGTSTRPSCDATGRRASINVIVTRKPMIRALKIDN